MVLFWLFVVFTFDGPGLEISFEIISNAIKASFEKLYRLNLVFFLDPWS